MKNSKPLQIYALVICAFSLIALAIGVADAIYQGVRISIPDITVSASEYRRISSNEAFVEQEHDPNMRKNMENWSDEEITAVRTAFGSTVLQVEQYKGRQMLANAFLMILVLLSLLAIHVRLLRRTRIANRED